MVIDLISEDEDENAHIIVGKVAESRIHEEYEQLAMNNLDNDQDGDYSNCTAPKDKVKQKRTSSKLPSNKLIGALIDNRLIRESAIAVAINEEFTAIPIIENSSVKIDEKYYYSTVDSFVPNLIRWIFEPFIDPTKTTNLKFRIDEGVNQSDCRFAFIAVIVISDCKAFLDLLLNSLDGITFPDLEEHVNGLLKGIKLQDHCPPETRLTLTFNMGAMQKAITAAQRKALIINFPSINSVS